MDCSEELREEDSGLRWLFLEGQTVFPNTVNAWSQYVSI